MYNIYLVYSMRSHHTINLGLNTTSIFQDRLVSRDLLSLLRTSVRHPIKGTSWESVHETMRESVKLTG